MKRLTVFLIGLLIALFLWSGVSAHYPSQEIIITVVVVFPSHTPTETPTETPTPTDGPSPTPTETPTATPANHTTFAVGGQDVVLDYTVTPGDAAIVGFLAIVAGLIIFWFVFYGRQR